MEKLLVLIEYQMTKIANTQNWHFLNPEINSSRNFMHTTCLTFLFSSKLGVSGPVCSNCQQWGNQLVRLRANKPNIKNHGRPSIGRLRVYCGDDQRNVIVVNDEVNDTVNYRSVSRVDRTAPTLRLAVASRPRGATKYTTH